MRIAQVATVYPPYRGGIGKVAHDYTDQLRRLGHQVEVFTPLYGDVHRSPSTVHEKGVHRLRPFIPFMKHGNAAFVPSLFKKLQSFDLIHLHYPFYGGAEVVALGRVLGKLPPLVLSFHMDAKDDGFKGKIFDIHRALLQGFVLNRAEKILVSSEDYAKSSSLAKHKLDSRLVEIPFAVDTQRFVPAMGDEKVELRKKFGLEPDTPTIVFVGGLDKAHDFKGVPELLRAVALIESPWQLAIVGDGDLRASFEALVNELNTTSRVHFLGNVDDENLPLVYRLGDVHVLPSTNRAEAFGIVTLEAAASGLPSIVSDLPGVRTVVEEGETGFVVPPKDVVELANKLEYLLTNPKLRGLMGENARARALEKYAWPVLIKELEGVYESVVTGK